ncbi:MAG: hypothetical protein QOG43_61 [Actinomycetota bacterium]|jgi:hypothetical protein|nr:hypothetical protein [Actinomycetota bacterium]
MTAERGGLRHCCDLMRSNVEQSCEQHPDPSDCPDNLIAYVAKFREYGLIIHDGGSSFIRIAHCPWCGTKLPLSERDRWFAAMEQLGIDPWEGEVPSEYEDDTWLRSLDLRPVMDDERTGGRSTAP